MIQPGLFDMNNRLESLSKFGGSLKKLREGVDFEIFRSDLARELDFQIGLKMDVLPTMVF